MTTKKLLLPATMSRAGWDVIRQRDDVEGIAYEYSLTTPAFHALLRDVDGVALGLTPFGEAELQAAPKLRVVARHGVGYDSVDVAAAQIGFSVEVPDGAAVVCDVYEFPENLSGQTPTPAPAQPTSTPKPNSTVTTLPSTGAGDSSSSNSALWLVIPAALAIGGFGLISKRRFNR